MHSKTKGNIAEAYVTLALMKIGCKVFKELGDSSRIDLIIEIDHKIFTVQVKGITPKDGGLLFKAIKAGPGYRYKYQPSDCNFFALCNLQNGDIALIKSEELLAQTSTNLRVSPAKNNQKRRVNLFSNHTDLLAILKKYS